MTQDLSANTLEAVRRNMTVMSLMVIVFFIAGGQVPDGGVIVRLPLSNVEFTKPERLLYVLWVMMAWWVYRYFALGAWSEFSKEIDLDAHFTINKGRLMNLVRKVVTDSPGNNVAAIETMTHLVLNSHFVGSRVMVSYLRDHSKVGSGEIKSPIARGILYLLTGVTGSRLVTFVLPLMITPLAFWLTISSLL